ncbi:tRNA (adenosine(37)-N6)-threonylcarbamoyltransferase complex dimerization subunit type 1 TsaB [bacterium]|nr:tRNA (adenosine(37)-N6)-threonylcarbamoyltransferase complex dimerization subunit type 1 TsaB [bacterium]
MRALGIDTATVIASVGLATDDAAVVRQRPMSSSHARTLLPLIDEVLETAAVRLSTIDVLAVSIGPGSFTGLRIGLAVVKGLALGSGLPVVAVPTLEAYARALGPRPGTVWPVLDARKGEVYAAGFRWSGAALTEVAAAAALSPVALASLLRPPCTLVGDGVDAYPDCWSTIPGVVAVRLAETPPDGAVVARLGAAILGRAGAADLATLEPHYCRRSEAELHRDASRAAAVSIE